MTLPQTEAYWSTPSGAASIAQRQPAPLRLVHRPIHPRRLSPPSPHHAMYVLRRLNRKVITMCAIIYIPTMIHNAGFNGADTSIILTGTAHNASRCVNQQIARKVVRVSGIASMGRKGQNNYQN